jgi:hypothetical protein
MRFGLSAHRSILPNWRISSTFFALFGVLKMFIKFDVSSVGSFHFGKGMKEWKLWNGEREGM